MNAEFQKHISNLLNEPLKSILSISGGDISVSYKVITSNNTYFLKTNSSKNALQMFKSEAFGLEYINKTKTIKSPTVHFCDSFQNTSFLLMDFIESKTPSNIDFEYLGLKLAELHKNSSNAFGLDYDNFIGSLPQSNKLHENWSDFYAKERLIPQLELAKQIGLLSNKECPSENIIINNVETLFTNLKPSLLHGDLWSGNYLISKDREPYLIDPAIFFGHHEVDIAMSKLFGGFGFSFYNAYHSIFPKNLNSNSRIELYQLYYLLVHLNLFGSSYYNSVTSILKKYF